MPYDISHSPKSQSVYVKSHVPFQVIIQCGKVLADARPSGESSMTIRRVAAVTAATVTLFIRKMRGISQAVLAQASDGNLYVVKFGNSPHGRDFLFKESAGNELYCTSDLPVSPWRPIIASDFSHAQPRQHGRDLHRSRPCRSGRNKTYTEGTSSRSFDGGSAGERTLSIGNNQPASRHYLTVDYVEEQ